MHFNQLKPNCQTKLSTIYFICHGKIDLWPISYVAKMFMAKMLVAKMPRANTLTAKSTQNHLYSTLFFLNLFFLYLFYLFIYFWLHWVLVVAHGIFIAACGIFRCGAQAQQLRRAGLVALWLVGSQFPNQGSNLRPLIGRRILNQGSTI